MKKEGGDVLMLNPGFYGSVMERLNPDNVGLKPVHFLLKDEFDKYLKEAGVNGRWEGEGYYDMWGIYDCYKDGCLTKIETILMQETEWLNDCSDCYYFDWNIINAEFDSLEETEIQKALEVLSTLYPGETDYYYPDNDEWSGWRVYKATFNNRSFLIAEGVYKGCSGRYLYYINGRWRSGWWVIYPNWQKRKEVWWFDFGNTDGCLDFKLIDTIKLNIYINR